MVACRALMFGVALCLAATPAFAQSSPWSEGVSDENKAKAKTHLDAGNALLVERKYVEALERYTQAIAFWDHPAIRFNMVRCYIQLNRNLEAHESLEKALAYGAAPHEETIYNEALGYQKLLATLVGEITVSCTQPGVALTLDGQALATCPAKQTKRVLAGEHQIVGNKQGLLPKTIELVVAGGQPRDVEITLDPLEKGARVEHRWAQWVPWSVFGGGLAVGGLGVLFQVLAVDQMRDYDAWVDRLCTGNCMDGELGSRADLKPAAELKSTVGVSLMVVGGAAVATGAVMLWLNRGRTVYPASLEVAPMPGGGAVSWSGRF